MTVDKINFDEKFRKLRAGDYGVGIVAKMNNYDIKIVKFKEYRTRGTRKAT